MNEALWYYYLSINAKEMSIQQNQWEKKPVQINQPFTEHEQEQKVNDNVNHPKHYAGGRVECIEAIEEATKDLTGIEAVCTANVLKYSWRWKKKNGVEDLKKAKWYLERLIKKLENESKGTEQ